MKAVTLMYHDVVEPGRPEASGFPTPDAHLYKLTRQDFAAHLEAISRTAGAAVGTTEHLRQHSRPPVLLTFDDGGISFFDPIAPMLEQHGWRGHFFISTDFIDTPGFLTRDHVRELRRRGHVIGSHSCSHPLRMAACSVEQLRREWKDSVHLLSSILGEPVAVASVPGGWFAPKVLSTAAEAGIRILFNSEPVTRGFMQEGCLVLGRFSFQDGSPAQQAAALASGDFWPAFRQKLFWDTKKIAKAIGGPAYMRIRERLLAGRLI